MSIEFKSFETKVAVNKERRTVEWYAAIFDTPDLSIIPDIIHKGAFAKTISERFPGRIGFRYMHTTPVGPLKGLAEDSKGLIAEGLVSKTRFGDEFLTMVDDGALGAGSIGYKAKDFLYERLDGKLHRQLKIIDPLAEVSVLDVGMHPDARVQRVKSMGGTFAVDSPGQYDWGQNRVVDYKNLPLGLVDANWDADEARQRVREWSGSEKGANSEFQKAFLHYDPSNADDFSAYGLIFADVVDGELKAIPKGIQEVSERILDGGEVPASILDGVRSHLSQYRTRVRRELGDDALSQKGEDDGLDAIQKFGELVLAQLKSIKATLS